MTQERRVLLRTMLALGGVFTASPVHGEAWWDRLPPSVPRATQLRRVYDPGKPRS